MNVVLRKLFFIFLFLSAAGIYAQTDNPVTGARAAALANTSVTIGDEWSLFNNPGAMAAAEDRGFGATHERRFGIAGFNTYAATAVFPLERYGTPGLGFYRFGDELFSIQKILLGYSHKIQNISLGIRADYTQLSIQDFGSKGVFVLSFGGTARILEQLFFGANIYNITQTKLAGYQDERIPVVMKAGLSYRPSEKLMVNVETEKNIEQPALLKAGVEYRIIDDVFLRTGVALKPYIGTYGVGFTPGNFRFDYALSSHSNLGLIHQISAAYRLRKK